MQRIAVAPGARGFVTADTKTPFHPWGMNHGNPRGLMEDFWDTDWKTLASDFHEMKRLGANVVRVHLQFGKFMSAPDVPNTSALKQLSRLLDLAETTGVYLDITGLACYRPSDTPKWYDQMEEPARWAAQARFWQAIAAICKDSPAVFCYDLANEVLSPGDKRKPGQWRSGSDLGGFDFLQFNALDPAGRTRDEIALAWIERLTAAIRKHDKQALVTVGLLPWSRQWKHLSGFVPEKIAPRLDFISVHLYPDRKKPGEALESLKQCSVGKPVVIEETFLLSCTAQELEEFLRSSRGIACGWIGHYNGITIQEYDALEHNKKLTIPQAMYREWLRLFVRLKPDFAPDS
jgi:hypothetical protein